MTLVLIKNDSEWSLGGVRSKVLGSIWQTAGLSNAYDINECLSPDER